MRSLRPDVDVEVVVAVVDEVAEDDLTDSSSSPGPPKEPWTFLQWTCSFEGDKNFLWHVGHDRVLPEGVIPWAAAAAEALEAAAKRPSVVVSFCSFSSSQLEAGDQIVLLCPLTLVLLFRLCLLF